MFALKVILSILLCCPAVYVAFLLLGKLMDSILQKGGDQ